VDLFPTLCSLMKLDLPRPPVAGKDLEYHHIDGRDLVPLIRGETDDVHEFSYAESGPSLAIQDLTWKLVISRECLDYEPDDPGWAHANREPQLYDLAHDPGETENLFATDHPQVLRLLAALREWDRSLPIPREAVAASHRDREAEHLLDSLGYTGGIGGEDEPGGGGE
jgi:arylsulfatase A-like enzyme